MSRGWYRCRRAVQPSAQVRTKLEAQGYAKVNGVKFEDGIWNAEADDPAGKDVELKIDPATGKVLGEEMDWAREY